MSMESSAIASAREAHGAGAHDGAEDVPPTGSVLVRVTQGAGVRDSRTSAAPRSRSRAELRAGMGFRHDVLLALIMAVAMAATVFLYR